MTSSIRAGVNEASKVCSVMITSVDRIFDFGAQNVQRNVTDVFSERVGQFVADDEQVDY